jgi:Protein of unknown function (DUF2849)
MPFVLTGNRLDDGRVVYLSTTEQWVFRLEEAVEVESETDRDERLARLRDRDRRTVTGIYALEVEVNERGERLLSARERIRAGGHADLKRRLGWS